MRKKKFCSGLFAHSLDKLKTEFIDKYFIFKKCPKCNFTEALRRSNKSVLFPNNLLQQKKKWAADDNKKELLQPRLPDGSANPDFTEAFGYNPFDERTKINTPTFQGGEKQM